MHFCRINHASRARLYIDIPKREENPASGSDPLYPKVLFKIIQGAFKHSYEGKQDWSTYKMSFALLQLHETCS